jgi:hypothetical protein
MLFDAVDVGGDARGSGQLSRRAVDDDTDLAVMRAADVPPSLRAYVRRYLEGMSTAGGNTGGSRGSRTE